MVVLIKSPIAAWILRDGRILRSAGALAYQGWRGSGRANP